MTLILPVSNATASIKNFSFEITIGVVGQVALFFFCIFVERLYENVY